MIPTFSFQGSRLLLLLLLLLLTRLSSFPRLMPNLFWRWSVSFKDTHFLLLLAGFSSFPTQGCRILLQPLLRSVTLSFFKGTRLHLLFAGFQDSMAVAVCYNLFWVWVLQFKRHTSSFSSSTPLFLLSLLLLLSIPEICVLAVDLILLLQMVSPSSSDLNHL